MKSPFRATASVALAVTMLLGIAHTTASAQTSEFESYAKSNSLTGEDADAFRLYRAFFDREPDLAGAAYWVGQIDKCASLLDITWSFSNSSEFLQRYGTLSDERYIDLVYANVLDRAPDAEGRQYWLDQLTNGKIIQSEVMLYFSLGTEFRRRYPLPSDGLAPRGCTPPAPKPTTTDVPVTTKSPHVSYANCAEVRAAQAAPLLSGEPGYRPGLDRDGDGVACEN